MTAANTDTQNLESSKPTDSELSETQLDGVAGGGSKLKKNADAGYRTQPVTPDAPDAPPNL